MSGRDAICCAIGLGQICDQWAIIRIQHEMTWPTRRDQQFLTIDAKLQLCPVTRCMSFRGAGAALIELTDVLPDFESGEGVGVDLTRVVEHDDVGGRAGDGEDDGAGVVGAEVGAGDVEGVRGILGAEVPELDGVVE